MCRHLLFPFTLGTENILTTIISKVVIMKPSVNIVENSIQKVYETRFKFAYKDVKDTE